MLEDPTQRLIATCNHEAGHAVAMHWFDMPIREIDVNHPERWSLGHVVPEPREIPPPPEGLDHDAVIAWLDGYLFHDGRKLAVTARMGGMMGNHDWLSESCAHDREIVLKSCPKGFQPATWEALIELAAENLRDNPRFCAAQKRLAIELHHNHHDVMPGARAVEIIEQALAEHDAAQA
jgi:hypothetical protein